MNTTHTLGNATYTVEETGSKIIQFATKHRTKTQFSITRKTTRSTKTFTVEVSQESNDATDYNTTVYNEKGNVVFSTAWQYAEAALLHMGIK